MAFYTPSYSIFCWGEVAQKWLAGVINLDIVHHGIGLTMSEKDTTFNTDDEIIFGKYIR